MELKQDTLVAERFRLTRMIGRGGMGSVWAAQDCRLDNQCAVKFIEGEIANVADAQARFAREAKAAAQLRSPHVVEIKDYGVWEGRPYIAMELLDGEDLGKFLQRNGGKLHPSQVNPIIQQVCRALTKAHAAGIVHRDLKPDNIFLVNDDDRQLVKILDFGVAKQTSQTIDGSNTKTGAMLGTPYYMSPEQAQGIKTVDSRSDLWSLAVIVYHLIIGKLPFESEALGDLLVKIIVNPIPTPSHIAQVPPGFDRWWARAADRNPDARFQTAKDFGTDLALALGGTVDIGIGMRTPPQSQFTGTAMMTNAALPPSSFQSTPQPGAAPSRSPGMPGAGMSTPQPMMNTPHGALGHTGNRLGPPPNTPPPSLSASGSPATFSGVEPPIAIPKKGPPPALLAAVGVAGVLAIVGVLLLVSRRAPTAGHEPSPPSSVPTVIASASASEVASVVAPAESQTAEPPPSETPPPAASAEAPVPATAAATAAATAPGSPTRTHAGGGFKPPVVPPPKPTAAASTKKWNAGF